MMVALFVPAITVIVIGTIRVSAMIIHHGLLSLWAGRYHKFINKRAMLMLVCVVALPYSSQSF